MNPELSHEHKKMLLEVLAGQSLADHLGDVRSEEGTLWEMLGVSKEDRRSLLQYDSAFQDMKRVAIHHGLGDLLPDWVKESDDE